MRWISNSSGLIWNGRWPKGLDSARDEGLVLIEGRKGPGNGGYFVPVTIVDNPPEESEVVQEEAFGPVLPMMRFKDVDVWIGFESEPPPVDANALKLR